MQIGDIGTDIVVTVVDTNGTAVNISTATALSLKLQQPDGTVLTRTAVFNTTGTDGKIKYTTVAGDLPLEGKYSLQAVITLPTGTWTTDITSFMIQTAL